MFADRVGKGLCAPQEDTAVPGEIACGEKSLGCCAVRLLAKATYAPHRHRALVHEGSLLNIAIPGLDARRRNAQNDDIFTRSSQTHASFNHLGEARDVGNHVIGREDSQHAAGVFLLQQKRGQRACRSSVAGSGFAQNVFGRKRRHLRGDGLVEPLIRHHPDVRSFRHRQQTGQRLLNHRLRTIKREHLFRVPPPAARPEPRTAAAGQNDRRKPNPIHAHRPLS